MHYPSRWHSYSPEGYFDRPFMRNHFDDPYLYGDNMCGTKRPLYMRVGFHIPPCHSKILHHILLFCFLPFGIVLIGFRIMILIMWSPFGNAHDWIILIQQLHFMETVIMVWMQYLLCV